MSGTIIHDICSICLNEYDENVCETQCHHRFCKSCLDQWFDKNSLSCPLCRSSIQYFTYQGSIHRVVCVYRGRNLPVIRPPNANPSMYMVSRRNMILMNVFMLFSLTSTIFSIGYIIQCEGCSRCEECDCSMFP